MLAIREGHKDIVNHLVTHLKVTCDKRNKVICSIIFIGTDIIFIGTGIIFIGTGSGTIVRDIP